MSKGRILAIDDDKFFRKLYEGILLSEGFFVRTAEGGREALDILKEDSFDIVITDMMMPDWDGIRTVEEIKKISPDQDIIMVTQLTDLETAVEAVKSGAAEYVIKPFEKEDLLNSIRRLQKRHDIYVEHKKLVEENIEHFEILSTYKKCLDILSITNFDKLVDSIAGAMTAESGSREGIFWFCSDESGTEWEIKGSVSEHIRDKSGLPKDDDSWKEKMEVAAPFVWPDKEGSLFVPLSIDGHSMAVVELSAKRGKRHYDDKDLKNVGKVAEFSRIALGNAEKMRLLESHSFMEGRFGLYTYSFFEDSLERQIAIAFRYRRPFSIIYMKVGNFGDLEGSFGKDAVRSSMRTIIERVKEIIRNSDVMGMKDEGEYGIILTETDYFGSIMAIKRVEDGIAGAKYVSDGESTMPIDLMLMSASYPRDGTDKKGLVDTVSRRMEDARESLFQRLDLSEKNFWESVDVIFDKGEREVVKGTPPSCSVYADFGDGFYRTLLDSFVNEVLLRPFLRGVLFLGADTISPRDDYCRKIAAVENLATRVFVVGKRGEEKWNIPNITPVYLKEGEAPTRMVLFLNEETGYAFVERNKGGDGCNSFHTSDIFLVEKLISRLRNHYLLQWI